MSKQVKLITFGLQYGAEGVSQSYDYLEALFNDIKAILLRLQVHTHNNVPGELRQIYGEILICILDIFAVSTKYINEGRLSTSTSQHSMSRYFVIDSMPITFTFFLETFLKRTMKPDDSKAADLKDRLSILVGQETAMVGALNLGVTMDVRTILSRETRTLSGLNHQINDIKLALQGILGL